MSKGLNPKVLTKYRDSTYEKKASILKYELKTASINGRIKKFSFQVNNDVVI
jgi:hypothetical protein